MAHVPTGGQAFHAKGRVIQGFICLPRLLTVRAWDLYRGLGFRA